MTDKALTITAPQAAILYVAIGKAIAAVRLQMQLKSSKPYAGALALEISAYEGERWALEQAFPELKR